MISSVLLYMWEEEHMNTNQFAFIICTNNEQYYNECVRYIQDLYVPEGYNTDIICIQDADSMAQGYNAGMLASEACYKIYLHQDTFILDRYFLYNILKIFTLDESIGMIGVLGARELPGDANCYLKWDTGRVAAYSGERAYDLKVYQEKEKAYIQVKAIDGLIMITQVDIPWREEIFDGWDFYDISQSLEMDRHGYKVVIPYQEKPWCYHDCGVSEVGKYHFYRHKMIDEYPEYFIEDEETENIGMKQQRQEEIERIRSGMIRLIAAGAYDELADLVRSVRETLPEDTYIREIANLMEIYSLEKASSDSIFSEWWLLKDWEQIYEYYRWVRFVLLRIGYQREDERADEVRILVKEGRISREAVSKISDATIGNTVEGYSYVWNTEEKY